MIMIMNVTMVMIILALMMMTRMMLMMISVTFQDWTSQFLVVRVSRHCTANTGHRYTEMLMILFFPPFTFTFTFICFECGKEDKMWKWNKVKVSGHCTANNTGHRFTEILMILFLSTFYFHFLSSALKVEKKKTVKVELCFFFILSFTFIIFHWHCERKWKRR